MRIYVDMDGVLCDIHAKKDLITVVGAGHAIFPEGFFASLKPIDGAIESFRFLADNFDTWIASRPPWDLPSAWAEKREWVEHYLGMSAKKRLILLHDKKILRGDIIIDDDPDFVREFMGHGILFTDWSSALDQVVKYNSAHLNNELAKIKGLP